VKVYPSFRAFEKAVTAFAEDLDGTGLRKITTAVAVETKGDPSEAAKADPMNGSFSGWRRGNPIELKARYEDYPQKPGVFEVMPAPKAKGPWRVAQEGRHPMTFGPVLPKFTKTGKVSKVQRRAKRWNGVTRGFDTWDDAEKIMRDKVPPRVEAQVSKSMGRYF